MIKPAMSAISFLFLLQLLVLDGRSAVENNRLDGVWNIRAFGAIGDGRTLNTVAFEKAVAAARSAGGGTILVPAGVYVTGTVQLWSNMTLQLQPGAVLKGSPEVRDYKLPGQREVFSSGARDTASVGLITARGAENKRTMSVIARFTIWSCMIPIADSGSSPGTSGLRRLRKPHRKGLV